MKIIWIVLGILFFERTNCTIQSKNMFGTNESKKTIYNSITDSIILSNFDITLLEYKNCLIKRFQKSKTINVIKNRYE